MYDVKISSGADDPHPIGCGPILRATDPDGKPLRQQVFEFVRAAGRAARADIARSLGISAASVTTLTADLIAQSLLREVDASREIAREIGREAGRGRPPVALEVVPEGRRVVGIKLSDERHTAVLADFAGTVIAEATLASSNSRRTNDALADEVMMLVARVLQDVTDRSDILAYCIGVAGLVEADTGTVQWSPLLKGRNVPLAAVLSARLGAPVFVDNDANMLTLAELWFGSGRTTTDFAVVTIENGVGMGLVIGNRLWRGARGMGMELGHVKVQLDGALCRCGKRGCLEAYVADYALTREAATALARPPTGNQEILDDLFAEAKGGNQGARTIFRRAGRYLSLGLSNVIQLFDPELIILSGERMRYDYLYAEEVLAEMQNLTLSDGRRPCKIEIHAWGDMVWARGATARALSAATETILG